MAGLTNEHQPSIRIMSDDEDVEQFETADSGASTTIPMQAGNVRKGGFMVIKGRPTKVSKRHSRRRK